MGRKKSGRRAASEFQQKTRRIRQYLDEIDASDVSKQAATWAYEAALLKASVAFELLMLECLIVALNNDSRPFSQTTGISFPKHMTEKHCEYLITGGGYFDFKGRDGLIKEMKTITGDRHYLLTAVKNDSYFHALDLLLALRNYAAHESPQSKKKMKEAILGFRIGVKDPQAPQYAAQLKAVNAPTAAGAWLKVSGRFRTILDSLDALADEIRQGAPY